MTILLECGEDELDGCTAVDEEDGVTIRPDREIEVHVTRSPRGGSTLGGAPPASIVVR
jgi:hypothetical protein